MIPRKGRKSLSSSLIRAAGRFVTQNPTWEDVEWKAALIVATSRGEMDAYFPRSFVLGKLIYPRICASSYFFTLQTIRPLGRWMRRRPCRPSRSFVPLHMMMSGFYSYMLFLGNVLDIILQNHPSVACSESSFLPSGVVGEKKSLVLIMAPLPTEAYSEQLLASPGWKVTTKRRTASSFYRWWKDGGGFCELRGGRHLDSFSSFERLFIANLNSRKADPKWLTDWVRACEQEGGNGWRQRREERKARIRAKIITLSAICSFFNSTLLSSNL